jgi:hypothetical protein
MIFFLALILILWFNTEVFVEYCNLLRLPFFKTKQYIEAKKQDCSLSYHTYLLSRHNCFFVRLITCPICFNFWMCLLLYIFSDYMYLEEFPFIFISSLLSYFIFNKLSP